MKISPRLILLLFGAFIFSCSKESLSDLGYPTVYHKSGTGPQGKLRVFASTGEINNKDIISRFNEYDSSLFDNSIYNIGIDPSRMDSIIFSDPWHAVINHNYAPVHCLVKREGKDYLLTRMDTTNGSTELNELSHNINYYIGQVKPDLYYEALYSSTRGQYIFSYLATEKFILSNTGTELTAPWLTYKLYRAAINGGGGNYYGNMNNRLQDDFFKNLDPGDTVVVSEFQVIFKK